jgi:hypothetical protein
MSLGNAMCSMANFPINFRVEALNGFRSGPWDPKNSRIHKPIGTWNLWAPWIQAHGAGPGTRALRY